jgi:hypothetical protein
VKFAGLESVDVRNCALTDFSFLDKCVALTHLNLNGNGGLRPRSFPRACACMTRFDPCVGSAAAF